jgi:hypothetical protein
MTTARTVRTFIFTSTRMRRDDEEIVNTTVKRS